MSFSITSLWLKANKDLNMLLEEDEMYWKQRSREDWLQWRDKNLKRFQHKVTDRTRMNNIVGLKNSDVVWVSNSTILVKWRLHTSLMC